MSWFGFGSKEEPIDEDACRAELKELVKDAEDFDGYLTDTTIERSLRARDWKVKDAHKMLMGTLAWRKSFKPTRYKSRFDIELFQKEGKGYHSWRQVGTDRGGMAVTYSCVSQGKDSGLVPADCVEMAVDIIENAVPTNPKGQDFYVWVLDFTGITMGSCNPRLAAATNKVTSKHYPERMGYTIVVNAPWIFNATWAAIKVFADPDTVSKFIFVKQSNMEEKFREKFPDDLTDWLVTEIKLNLDMKANPQQLEWWKAPPAGIEHDARGCPHYVKDWIEPYIAARKDRPRGNEEVDWNTQMPAFCPKFADKVHVPHTNIVLHELGPNGFFLPGPIGKVVGEGGLLNGEDGDDDYGDYDPATEGGAGAGASAGAAGIDAAVEVMAADVEKVKISKVVEL